MPAPAQSHDILSFPSTGEVRRLIIAYLDHLALRLRAGKITEKTAEKPRHYLGVFSRDFGEKSVSELHPNTLEKWIISHPEWQSPHTLLDAIGCVMACFDWGCHDEEMISRNPLRRPKDLPTPGPRKPLFKSEYRALMRTARRYIPRGSGAMRRRPASANFRAALWFLWSTGCRPGEMLEAEWSDLDWRTGVLRLYSHKTARKTGQHRALALNRWILFFLSRHAPQVPEQGQKIFPNLRGGHWGEFSKVFRRFANLSGIPKDKSAYCLRHGVCVDLIEHGATDRQAADILGHSSTRYVSWYGRGTKNHADYLRRIQDLRRQKPK